MGLVDDSSTYYYLYFPYYPAAELPLWINPAIGRISSPFGYRYSPITGVQEFHDGVDVAIPENTPLVAPRYGYVTATGFSESFGWFLRIAHSDYYESFFAHLNHVPLAVGDRVEQGDHVAYSGNTGWSTAPHLHFSIFRGGRLVDPLEYFDFASSGL